MTVREVRRLSTLATLMAGIAIGFVLCITLWASVARALTTTLLDQGGQNVTAYRGWAAWSRYDAATQQFALVLRSPAGAITLPAIPERQAPFDVELGPNGAGVAAVYSRCSDAAAL